MIKKKKKYKLPSNGLFNPNSPLPSTMVYNIRYFSFYYYFILFYIYIISIITYLISFSKI